MQEQSWKVTLPGPMYQRAGQWWWQVRLPGEDAVKTRLLETPGVGTATCDPEIAERAAIRMWEQAVVREATARIILDCTQKVGQFKAQLLDRLGRLTEIVQSATATAQAEASARAQIESRLKAVILAAGPGSGDAQQKAKAPTSSGWDLPTDPRTVVPYPAMIEENPARTGAGPCECCGRTDLPTTGCTQIDSGQWLCPDCLHNLRADAIQAELDALTESLA